MPPHILLLVFCSKSSLHFTLDIEQIRTCTRGLSSPMNKRLAQPSFLKYRIRDLDYAPRQR